MALPTPPGPGWSGAAGRAVGRPQSRLRLGSAGCRRPSPGRAICWRRCSKPTPPEFPFLALLVSGGHTLLAEVRGLGRVPDHRLLARRRRRRGLRQDGQAARLAVSGRAGAGAARATAAGPGDFSFPRPMLDRPGLDFSFSGLKTAVVVATRDLQLDEQTRADVACEFQQAVVETLVAKCARAADADRIVDAGRRRRRRRESVVCAASSHALGRARGAAGPVSAAGVLHGQRGDDRVRWLSPPGRRRARRSEDSRHRALAARHAASAAALDLMLTDDHSRMDKIFLSALSVECIVGIWEWERRVKQTVIIDLEMAADIRQAAATRSHRRHDRLQASRQAPAAPSSASRSSSWSRR